MGKQVSNEKVREVAMSIRKLYRTTLTEEEAQDGWVKLTVAQRKYALTDGCGILDATYYEFTWRMTAMKINYANFDKLYKALGEFDEVSE